MGTYGIEIRIILKNIDINILCVGTFDAIVEASISCNFQEVKKLATQNIIHAHSKVYTTTKEKQENLIELQHVFLNQITSFF